MKILSYNMHKGRSFFFRRNMIQAMKKKIHEVDAEIVFLQETKGDQQQFEEIADTVWPHYRYGQNAVTARGRANHGNAILSKFPILEWENIDLTVNQFEKRGLLYARTEVPVQNSSERVNLHLFCTHLNLLQKDRLRQLPVTLEAIRQKTGRDERVIFAGDFNDWQNQLTGSLQRDVGMQECFLARNGKTAATSPAVLPLLSLDRIYYRNLTPLHASVLDDRQWRWMSDHLPVMAEFTV